MTTDLIDITVDVTQEDIDHGEIGECETCPIARAISRAVGKTALVIADNFCFDHNDMTDYPLPKVASDFVRQFDSGVDVSPFSFPISVPASYLEFSPCNSEGDGR